MTTTTEIRYVISVKTRPSFIANESVEIDLRVPEQFEIDDVESFAWSVVISSTTDWNSYGNPIRETMKVLGITRSITETREELL